MERFALALFILVILTVLYQQPIKLSEHHIETFEKKYAPFYTQQKEAMLKIAKEEVNLQKGIVQTSHELKRNTLEAHSIRK